MTFILIAINDLWMLGYGQKSHEMAVVEALAPSAQRFKRVNRTI